MNAVIVEKAHLFKKDNLVLKRIFRNTILIVLGLFVMVKTMPAAAACTTLVGNFLVSPQTSSTFSVAAGETIVVEVQHPGVQVSAEIQLGPAFTTVALLVNQNDSLTLSYTSPVSGTYQVFVSDNEGLPTGLTTYTISVGCSSGANAGAVVPFRPDSRINPHQEAPVAVYCQDDDLVFYAIGADSKGTLALYVKASQLTDTTPAVNTLIAQADPGISLYRLTNGQLQMNVGPDAEGKYYTYIWSDCDPDSGVHYTL